MLRSAVFVSIIFCVEHLLHVCMGVLNFNVKRWPIEKQSYFNTLMGLLFSGVHLSHQSLYVIFWSVKLCARHLGHLRLVEKKLKV